MKHVLIIPSEPFLPRNNNLSGIFQKHQGQALVKNGFKVGFLSLNIISIYQQFKKLEYLEKDYIFKDSLIVRCWIKSIIPSRFVFFNLLLLNFYCIRSYKRYVLEKGTPDTIYAHNMHFAGYFANLIKQKFNIPYILIEHNSQYLRGSRLPFSLNKKLKILNESVVFCTVSNFLMDFFVKKYQITVPKRVIPNVLDDVFENFQAFKKRNEPFEFVSIGSLDNNKNHELLINSFSEICENKNFRLTIVGDGINYNKLFKLTEYLGIDNKVRFIKYLSSEEIILLLKNSNCLVSTSLVETFGVVLIEAGACGCLLISTDSGGPKDIINEKNGLLVPINNKEQLSYAMLQIYKNFNSYDSIEISKNTILNFGASKFAESFSKILNEIKNSTSPTTF
jgi:glycosyltransferase involved in cell wall biosynthesis